MNRVDAENGIRSYRNLPGIALDVQMTCTGSYDRSLFWQFCDVVYLELILDNWSKTIGSNVFQIEVDRAIWCYIDAVLKLYYSEEEKGFDELIKSAKMLLVSSESEKFNTGDLEKFYREKTNRHTT